MQGKWLIASFILTTTGCGGGSNSGSGDSIDTVVNHLNATSGITYRGTIVSHLSSSDATNTDLSCFHFPAQTRDEFLEGKSVLTQSTNGVCFQGAAGCYEVNESTMLRTPGIALDVITNSLGHVIASQPYSFAPNTIYLSVEERLINEADSCGTPSFTTFEDVSGTYSGHIYHVTPDVNEVSNYRSVRSAAISLFCNTDACTIGENNFLKSDTNSNTYREAVDGGHILKGEFTSKDGAITYKFIGAASTSSTIIGGIVYPELAEDELLDCSTDCLVLVFEK